MKTYQAMAKRFRVTKKNKLIQKSTGQNHFRTKKRGSYVLAKRRKIKASEVYQKTILKRLGS